LPNSNHPTNRKGFWRGLPLQLFLVTVLPLTILLLVVAFGSQKLHQEAMRSMVGDRDLRAVRAAASSLELEIMHRSSTIQMLARSMGDSPTLDRLLLTPEELASTYDGGLALFTADGGLVKTTNPQDFWSGINASLPGYLSSVSASHSGPVFSKPFRVGKENQALVLVGVSTASRQVLVGAFSPAILAAHTIMNAISSGQTSAMLIAPAGGAASFDLLYHAGPSHQDASSSSHPGIQDSLNGESGINYYDAGGEEHVVAFSPIQPLGWGLVTEEAWEDIASPYLNTTQAAPLVVVPLLLLALLALWFGATRIVRPLQALEKQAAELARGNFESIRQPVGGIGEIRNLQHELIEMAEKLEGAQQSLHNYIGAMTAGIENERRSLARDLHDDTIQSLIVLNQRIQLASRAPADSPVPLLKELQNLVQESIVNLRRLVRGLRPIYLDDLGLVSSLKVLVQETAQQAGLEIVFEPLGDERRLDSQVEMMLYRMVQEALSNIVRHAQAAHARVALSFLENDLRVEIRDDGKGFALPTTPAEFARKDHFGLLGLQERADIINARLDIQSRPGEGTTVCINLAYPPAAEPASSL